MGYTFSTIAGKAAVGSCDGVCAEARFLRPKSVAVDRFGNVYVADTDNHTIRKIATNGVVTTVAGSAGASGHADGTAGQARFSSPRGLAVDSSLTLYVADTGTFTVRKITPQGVVSTLAGCPQQPGSVDGVGTEARFDVPWGVAVDAAGNVYVSDSLNCTIRKVTPDGRVTTLAGFTKSWDYADGPGTVARFCDPRGLAVDGQGNVYVADTFNYVIRKITPGGVVSTVAGLGEVCGSADGQGSSARFNSPQSLAVDAAGNIYVADSWNHTVRKITPDGLVSTIAGTKLSCGSADGVGSAARFNCPLGIAVDSAGVLYVADTDNSTIRKITPSWVTSTLAGTTVAYGTTDATGSAARFNEPRGVATDTNGNVYIADYANHTIRKIATNGAVSTYAGVAGSPGSEDGPGGTARFNYPWGLAADSIGNLYVAECGNHTIRKINPEGWVKTLAGRAEYPGSVDGSGRTARFSQPLGVAVDRSGVVYVADYYNNTIRRVSPSGAVTTEVTTIAGSPGNPGNTDGEGATARFDGPSAIAVDSDGNLYVADTNNDRIRKITPDRKVTTLATTGNAFELKSPYGVTVDAAGTVYVANTGRNIIQQVGTDGVLVSMAGAVSSGSADGSYFGAAFDWPSGITIDASGNLFVADTFNHTVRKGAPILPTYVVEIYDISFNLAGEAILKFFADDFRTFPFTVESTASLSLDAQWSVERDPHFAKLGFERFGATVPAAGSQRFFRVGVVR